MTDRDYTSEQPCNACYVGDNEALRDILRTAWDEDTARWTFYAKGGQAAGMLLTSPPDILLCSLTLPDMSGLVVARMLKEENVYSQVPVIMCLTDEEMQEERDWSSLPVDDFLVFPTDTITLRARLDLARARSAHTLDANPLTRLPGNTSIIKRTQNLIDQHQDFALGYCDLDNFKPFNDKYGFSRGDEVLMMTARILLNSVHNLDLPFSFVGHVGGDDYVFIVPVDSAETVCKNVISAFDGIIPHFYDEEDTLRGCIASVDRKGNNCTFPMMGLSISVVFNRNGSIKHYGEASHLAMTLKSEAKKSVTSSYVMDRRAGGKATPEAG